MQVEKTEATEVETERMEDTIAQTLRDINEREQESSPDDEKLPEKKERDESGKFVKAETPEPVEKKEPAESPETPETPEKPEPQDNRAPSSWKPAAKAKWDQTDPEIRSEILRREEEVRNWAQGVMPDAQFGKNLKAVIEPYRMLIDSEGGTPEGAVADLLRTAAIFRVGTPEQKQTALLEIARTYNVPLQAEEGQQQFLDPRVDLLLQRQKLAEQQYQEQQRARNNAIVSKWSGEMKDGKPVRPFVANVEIEMLEKIHGIQARNPHWSHEQVLQDAYERAVRENPETYAIVLAEEQAKAEAKRREANLQKVSGAKKAASVNVPKRGGLPVQAPVGSMEETIRQTYREITG